VLFSTATLYGALFLSRPVLGHQFQRLTSDIAHRKGGPRHTCQEIGQSSNISTIDPDVGDRHRQQRERSNIGGVKVIVGHIRWTLELY